FRYAFANAVGEDEAQELYNTYAVPGSGVPLFQAATANLNPWTEAKVKSKNPDRGPLLIIDGEKDHTVPWAIANASYKKQQRNKGVTEIVEIPGRGHSPTTDHGWRAGCEPTVAGIRRDAVRWLAAVEPDARPGERDAGSQPRGRRDRADEAEQSLARHRPALPRLVVLQRDLLEMAGAGESLDFGLRQHFDPIVGF